MENAKLEDKTSLTSRLRNTAPTCRTVVNMALLTNTNTFLAVPSTSGALRRVTRRRSPAPPSSSRVVATVQKKTSNPIKVSFGEESTEVPGSGGVVGSGSGADAVVKGGAVDAAHAKVEVRQGRIFLTALSKEKGTFLNGSRLFPGVAYAVAEGAVVVRGEGAGAATVAVEQVGEVREGGVDVMAQMMQMQFEATMSPEVGRCRFNPVHP
jgi:hypothetical protein